MTIWRAGAWRALLLTCVALAVPTMWASSAGVRTACYRLALGLTAAGLVAGLLRTRGTDGGEDRAAWRWLAAGTLSGVTGLIVLQLPGQWPQFHGLGVQDLCWLAVYPLVLRGVLLRIARQGLGGEIRRAVVLDTVVVTSAAAVVTWHLAIAPSLPLFASAGPLPATVAIAYPLGDVAMFALAAALLLSRARRGPADTLLVVALALELPLDLGHALLLAHAPDADDAWFRAGYVVINGMLAGAVLYPPAAGAAVSGVRHDSFVHSWRLLVLGTGLSAITLSAIFLPESGWHRLPVALAAVATLVAVLLRFDRAVRALESAERVLQHQATHDQLTGAANRSLLLSELTTAVRHSVPALIFVDLDGFKRVNDDLGHQAGDDVLLTIARRITAVVRSGDLVARLGGDEFVVVCPDVDEEHVAALAARIGDTVRTPLTAAGRSVRVGASVGILVAESFAGGVEEHRVDALVTELLEAADAAMYEAKRSGAGIRMVRHTVAA